MLVGLFLDGWEQIAIFDFHCADLVSAMFHWVEQYGYFGLFSSLVLGIVGLPLPDEGLLTFAGYLVYKGNLTLSLTIVSAFLGSVCGISLSYFLGRTVGVYLLDHYARNLVSDQKMRQVHDWFERFGKWGLLLGYFVPGIRHLTALVAGASQLEPPIFALFAYSGALIWSSTFIALGYMLGEQWEPVSGQIRVYLMIFPFLVIIFAVLFFFLRKRS